MPNLVARFIRRHLVGNVPSELELCFNCRRATCSAEDFRTCTRRLQRDELAASPLPRAAHALHDPRRK